MQMNYLSSYPPPKGFKEGYKEVYKQVYKEVYKAVYQAHTNWVVQ